MDIVTMIAVIAAFLLGAYIRKPFKLWEAKEARPQPQSEAPEEAEGLTLERQLNNMMNYNGKPQ